jgi:L-ascorbate metabolism protein UlaG (beta-lactamase superfamily)
MIRVMMLSVISVFILVPLVIVIVGYGISAPGYRGPISDHFDGKTFINPMGIKSKGLMDVIKWSMNRTPGEWNKVDDARPSVVPSRNFTDGIRITFVNHSTFLIQTDSINILTDPVWSERVSPFTWIGPARMRPPGIRFEDLPKIDAIVLSHNHYDHLDLSTMRRLFVQHKPEIITPMGIKKFLDDDKITGANDLDWWDSYSIRNVVIQSVPAQHFSGRGIFDRDATLWCGYVIKTKSGNIYFAGDTGYNDKTFKDIGARSGVIKAALIPIGAYKPNWFMSPIHVSPEEAIKIHKDVNAERSIASHYGTFPLADDGQFDPIIDLAQARTKHGIKDDEFITLVEGHFIEIK